MNTLSHFKQRLLVLFVLLTVMFVWTALVAIAPISVYGQIQQSSNNITGPVNVTSGGLSVTGVVSGSSDMNLGSTGNFYWQTKTAMQAPSAGAIRIVTLALGPATSLQFGNGTSATPELLFSGNTIGIRGGDGTLPTFSTLPACAAGTAGQMAWITDSTTIVFAATITGGGANKVLAICDGTNWTVH